MFLENDKATYQHQSNRGNHGGPDHEQKEDWTNEVQLQGNIISPYFVSLEKLFNRHDSYIKKKKIEKGPTTSEYEGVNIGDGHNPKMINIGKCWSLEEKEADKQLLIEY